MKFNDLIREKETAEREKNEWLSNNNHQFYSDICWWQSRIDTVEHYLDHLSAEDSEFIKDLYIEPIGFKKVMKTYKINNEGNVYRKANNILRKYSIYTGLSLSIIYFIKPYISNVKVFNTH